MKYLQVKSLKEWDETLWVHIRRDILFSSDISAQLTHVSS